MRTSTDPESCDEETELAENDVYEERDPDFIEERFRVDRRKLENMLQGKTAHGGHTFIIGIKLCAIRFGHLHRGNAVISFL